MWEIRVQKCFEKLKSIKMKNALLLTILAFSLNAFTQGKGPILDQQHLSSNSKQNIQLTIEDERDDNCRAEFYE